MLDSVNEDILGKFRQIELYKNLGFYEGVCGASLLMACNRHIFSTYEVEKNVNYLIENVNEFESFTLGNGLTGLGYLLSYLKSKSYADVDVQLDIIEDRLMYGLNEYIIQENYDYLHGYLGIINYFLYCGGRISEIVPTVKRIFINLTQFLYKDSSPDELNTINFGLAHGIPSFLSVLVNFEQKYPGNCHNIIDDVANFIIRQRRDGRMSRYPSKLGVSSEFDSRLAWCYGDLGVNFSLLKFARFTKNSRIEEIALNDLIFSTKRKKLVETRMLDCGLCHGIGGAAYLYKYLYESYGEKEFLNASTYWKEMILFNYNNSGLDAFKAYYNGDGIAIESNGLMNGMGGILLALNSELFDDDIIKHIMLVSL